MSFSVVIPVLNEQEEIAHLLRAACEHLGQLDDDWEILVVDNASTDETCRRVEPFLADGHVRLLRNETNRGKGYSVRRGMLEARGSHRLMCDADNAPSLVSLPRMIEALERFDVVIGSRRVTDAQVTRKQPLRRRIVGRGFLVFTRLLLGDLGRDPFNGFKLWSGAAAAAVFPRVEIEGWVFDAEALALAKRLGFRVGEVGIEWSNRPNSRVAIREVLVPVVRELRRAQASVRRVPRAR